MPDPSFQPPDLSRSIAGRLRRLDGALVVPPAPGAPNRAVQRSGVFDAAGAPVGEALTWRGDTPITRPPEAPSGPVDALPGRWLFCGPLFGHFGHFMVESIARLWPLDAVRQEIDGLLFVPKVQHRVRQVARGYRPLLAALGADLPIRSLEAPARVERLLVPAQGFGMFGMSEGAPEFRAHMRRHAGQGIAAHGPEAIYVSRGALPAARGSILGEARLEAWLAMEGFVPFHPQRHDFATQIAAYKAARRIVSVDCSPLHLLALVGDPGQRVGVIARRPGGLDEIFARQIRAFGGGAAVAANALRRNWIAAGARGPDRLSWGEVDFARIEAALATGGLVRGRTGWAALGPDEVAAEVARIEAAAGHAFRAVDG